MTESCILDTDFVEWVVFLCSLLLAKIAEFSWESPLRKMAKKSIICVDSAWIALIKKQS